MTITSISSLKGTQMSGLASEKTEKDDYTIKKVIGQGSSATVYLVQDQRNLHHYAMKVIDKSKLDSIKGSKISSNTEEVKQPEAFENRQVETERGLLTTLNHPFIIRMKSTFETPEKIHFIMEFLNGGRLFYHLRREGKFTE